MTDDNREPARKRWRAKALIYSLVYLVLAGLWILLSGRALDFITSLAEIRADLEVYKGLLFVLLTTMALYALLRSWQSEMPDPVDAPLNSPLSWKLAIKLPVYFLLGLVLVVASGGYVTFEHLKQNELRRIEQNLSAVAGLKAEQIDGWFKQNIHFAVAAGSGSYLANSFGQWVRDGKLPADREQWVRSRIEILKRDYAHGDLSLVDLKGKVYAYTGRGVPPSVAEHLPGLLQRAADAGQPTLGELHGHLRDDGSRYLSLPLLAPLRPSGASDSVVGVLLFEMNPQEYLFPLVASWPTSSQSAETLLVRRVGDEVMYLNELRHRKGMALTTVKIGDTPSLLAAQVAAGKTGFITGSDYRGMSVVGYAAKIPDADWLMVAKVDADEIYLPVRRLAVNVTMTAFLLALVCSLSMYFWLRQRRARYETAQMKAELQQQILAKQLGYLSKYANDIILLMDDEGIIVQANDRAEAAYGYAHDELIGMSIMSLRLADDAVNTADQFRLVLNEKKSMLFETLHKRRDGLTFPVEVSSRLIETDRGKFVQSIIRDISERKQAEADLRLAATVFESSHGSIIITDNRAHIVAVNPAFSEITGYSPEEVIGKTPSILSSGRQGPEFYHDFWSSLEQTGRWQGELWNRRKNGEEYASWLSVSAIRDEGGVVKQYIGISDDITESKESQSKIQYLAYHDALTGLPNRLLASDRLEQAIAHAHRIKTRVAVMFLDLDDFKTINDTLGHSTGDIMLKAVAERLRNCVREADTVCRQGGDEFLVMLNDVSDLEAINSVAIDILDKVNRPYRVEDHDLTISTSIGIAIYPDDGQDCDTLMKNADMAMYNAKQSGRNTHRFFAEEMNDYVLEHLLIRNGLMRALENKEFRLHYQPQLDLASDKLVGAEALIRWQHPDLGMVPPNRFIQVAEDCGMIIPIGEWVLHEACRQAKAWHDAGFPGLVVGVNISAVQFRRGDMEQIVSAALAESGLSGQFLELELTESILIQDVGKSLETIRRLKELGVRLSIDDFGTGYSSLAYLRQLPVDKLKIDQSFVREITSRKDDAAIALSIITLAHTLQKKVIAEGVETREQLRFMREHHCDEVQGYLLSRPLPADAFDAFLKNGTRIEDLVRD